MAILGKMRRIRVRNMIHIKEVELLVPEKRFRNGTCVLSNDQINRAAETLCGNGRDCGCGVIRGLGMTLVHRGSADGVLRGVS